MPFSTLLHCRILELRNWTFRGGQPDAAKISSDAESIQLRLVPKPKLIRRLRELFTNAYIVGWKFELDGTPEDVVREGVQQIRAQPDERMHGEWKRFWARIWFLYRRWPCPHAPDERCTFGLAGGSLVGRLKGCSLWWRRLKSVASTFR